MVSYFLGNKSLLAMAADCMANNTCLACAVPNRYMVPVINPILSSFPKLMCHVMFLGNLIYFRRLYLMCLSTCSMKPISGCQDPILSYFILFFWQNPILSYFFGKCPILSYFFRPLKFHGTFFLLNLTVFLCFRALPT